MAKSGTNPKRKRKGMTPERQERAIKATELRRQGYTYAEIGDSLGVDESTAYRDVKKLLDQTAQEPADQLRVLELQRLDEIWKRSTADLVRAQKVWKSHLDRVNAEADLEASDNPGYRPLPAAVSPVVLEKVVGACQKVFQTQLKIMERRARMTGLDSFTGTISVDVRQSINDAFDTLMATPAEAFTDEG